jgi:hypothetical protein
MPNDKFVLQFDPSDLWKASPAYINLYQDLSLRVDGYRALNKESRKTAQATLETTLDTATTDSARTDAIRQYELDYENSSILLSTILATMQNTCQTAVFALTITGTNATPVRELSIKRQNNGLSLTEEPTIRIARLLTDSAMYQRLSNQPVFTLHDIYVHLENHRHYVKDKSGYFIRRLMWRAINQNDYKKINGHAGIEAPNLSMKATDKEVNNYGGYQTGDSISFDDAVFFHLQKGSNRFISLTSTKHEVYGNGGTSFRTNSYEKPKAKQTKKKKNDKNCFVVVDLCRVKRSDIVDVHKPEAIKDLLNMSGTEYANSLGNGDKTPEQRAARDTLRTRETLVHGVLGRSAIVYTSWDPDYNDKVTLDTDARAELAHMT